MVSSSRVPGIRIIAHNGTDDARLRIGGGVYALEENGKSLGMKA